MRDRSPPWQGGCSAKIESASAEPHRDFSRGGMPSAFQSYSGADIAGTDSEHRSLAMLIQRRGKHRFPRGAGHRPDTTESAL